MKLFLLAICLFAPFATSFPSGAPASVCVSMNPSHGPQPQTSTSPFTVTVDKTSVSSTGTVTVTIRATGGKKFKGFFIVARKAGSTDAEGEFQSNAQAKLVTCNSNSNSAITHKNNDDKSSISVQWKPSSALSGRVSFLATIVEDKDTFWTKVKSSPRSVTVQ